MQPPPGTGKEGLILNASWTLSRTMWVIQVAPTPGEATLLQAEVKGVTYVLCFTSDERARAAIAALRPGGICEGAWTTSIPEANSLELVSAMCQLGASGIIVDLDPKTHKCAWSRRLTAMA